MGYGWDAPDGGGGAADALAARSLTFWWERHPDLAAEEGNYRPAPPAGPAAPLGITLMPLLRSQGGPTIVPYFTADSPETIPLADGWKMAVLGNQGDDETRLDLSLLHAPKRPALSLGDSDDPAKGSSLELTELEAIGGILAKAGELSNGPPGAAAKAGEVSAAAPQDTLRSDARVASG